MIDVAATESKGVESELVSERKRGRLFVSSVTLSIDVAHNVCPLPRFCSQV